MPFFEEAVRRLAEGGLLGWSSSSTFLRISAGRPLRSLLGERCTLRELVEFDDRKVYPDAVTQIVLVLLEKGRREVPCRHVWVAGDGGLRDKLAALWKGTKRADITAVELPASRFRAADWSFGSAAERSLLERLHARPGRPVSRSRRGADARARCAAARSVLPAGCAEQPGVLVLRAADDAHDGQGASSGIHCPS